MLGGSPGTHGGWSRAAVAVAVSVSAGKRGPVASRTERASGKPDGGGGSDRRGRRRPASVPDRLGQFQLPPSNAIVTGRKLISD